MVVPALLTYVAVCAGIYWFQGALLYFPSHGYGLTPAAVGLDYDAVTLTTEDGEQVAAWFVPHDDPRATLLFCHGNAGNMADRYGTIKRFHQLGLNVLIFDYRGYGDSTGTPDETGTYADAEAAWRYLIEQRQIPAEENVIFGRSLGGAVAIELAQRHAPAALVVECTFTSVVDMGRQEYPFLPVSLLCTNRYESVRKVPQIRCPKLFLHGTGDELISMENARRLFGAAAEPKRFIETPGGHNEAGIEYSHETTAAFDEWLTITLGLQPN